MTNEIPKIQKNGWSFFFSLLIILIAFIIFFILGIVAEDANEGSGVFQIIFCIIGIVITIILLTGLFIVEPNVAVVLLLFGKYKGTEKTSGFRWANPFYTKKKISLRSRNFDSQKIKVNDKNGNPIEISSVIVWKVKNTAQAFFDVDSYIDYVHIQTESALRHLATSYAYDNSEGEEISLRSSIDEVSESLKKEIQERVNPAGVVIEEARINHLAYAQEIAQAMLKRQQAEAIIAARQKIVEGAVSMVDMALTKLKEQGVVELDEERKAVMVSNLMVVLCSDRETQPIVNTGSLY
ncbi:MAG: SPFH domain-containing protein [Ignavibacteriales bacterium]|jgi:regulator of protease activity HflC (stomatin/prohibitin superfamily)|nr:SPFH domain-containing protein [Ignavibacteriaceae bacterium]NLH60206.1 SPFH domain-containing protein [Ignavibacteriales bacterium]HOJ17324.1 SPFH domain-containing protein [Ignavibacteriaceae bacterium]HPO54858.1 SPFH domain-containing protein [Ignavibacteriaceae bacterium]